MNATKSTNQKRIDRIRENLALLEYQLAETLVAHKHLGERLREAAKNFIEAGREFAEVERVENLRERRRRERQAKRERGAARA